MFTSSRITASGRRFAASSAFPDFRDALLGPQPIELTGSHRHYDITIPAYIAKLSITNRREKAIVIETERYLVVCPFESKMRFRCASCRKSTKPTFSHRHRRAVRTGRGFESFAFQAYYKLGNPAYNYYIHTMPFSRSKNVSHNENATIGIW